MHIEQSAEEDEEKVCVCMFDSYQKVAKNRLLFIL